MAKQTSIFTIKGKLGGVSFYKSRGVNLAKQPGGADKARIMTEAKFQRTRENMSEFGGAATSARALRIALASASQNIADTVFVARLTQLFKLIGDKDTVNVRGQRSFLVSAHPSALEGVEFNKHVPLTTVLKAPFTITHNAPRNEGTLTVPAFDPSVYIKPTLGATHFRIVFALGTISDYVYNTVSNKYEPAVPLFNSLSALIYSPYLPLTAATADQSLIADLPGTPTLTAQVSVAAAVGIEFSQQIGAVQYPLRENNAMKIVALF